MLQFHNPHHGANMYMDPGNKQLLPEYEFSGRNLHLIAGQLVIFPSWQLHEVLPFHGDDERITVAFNCWFRPRTAAQVQPGPMSPPYGK